MKAFSKASAVAQEVLGSIRTVTAFGGQKKEEKRLKTNLKLYVYLYVLLIFKFELDFRKT